MVTRRCNCARDDTRCCRPRSRNQAGWTRVSGGVFVSRSFAFIFLDKCCQIRSMRLVEARWRIPVVSFSLVHCPVIHGASMHDRPPPLRPSCWRTKTANACCGRQLLLLTTAVFLVVRAASPPGRPTEPFDPSEHSYNEEIAKNYDFSSAQTPSRLRTPRRRRASSFPQRCSSPPTVARSATRTRTRSGYSPRIATPSASLSIKRTSRI